MGQTLPRPLGSLQCLPRQRTLCGRAGSQVLKSERLPWQKIKILVIAGLIGVTAGYALNPVTPIIKRICTSSLCLSAAAGACWPCFFLLAD